MKLLLIKYYALFSLLAALTGNLRAQPVFPSSETFDYQNGWYDSVFKVMFRSVDSSDMNRELNVWEKTAAAHNDQVALHWIRFTRIKYYSSGKQHDVTEYEKQMMALLGEPENINELYMQIKVLRDLAHHYFYMRLDYNKAFDTYRKMYTKLMDPRATGFPLKSYFLYDYGLAFYHFDDFDNAKKYLLQIASEKDDTWWWAFHNYTTLGLCYRKTGDFDSSTLFFEKSRKVGLAKNDSLEIGIALGNIGQNYFLQHQYVKAQPLLELDVYYSTKYDEWSNAASSMLSLAQITFSKGQTNKAKQQCLLALSYLERSYRKEEYAYYHTGYRLLSKIYAAQQNMLLAYAYADSAAAAKDSLHTKMNARILFNATRKIEAEKHEAEIARYKNEYQYNLLIRNSLAVILVLVMVIFLLMMNKRRSKYRQDQLLQQKEQERIGGELKHAHERLRTFSQNIIEKSQLIEHLQKTLGSQSEDAISALRQQTILTQHDWEQFRELFEKAHAGYLARLKEKLPDLSPAEIRFITLAKLEFTSGQMAETLGIGKDAVRMMRHRLRKKLNLTEEGSLEELIATI